MATWVVRGSQLSGGMQTSNDWGSAVVVDPRLLSELNSELNDSNTARRRTEVALKACAGMLAIGCLVAGGVSYRQASHISDLAGHVSVLTQEVNKYRRSAHRSDVALGALAKSHENILAATEKSPSLGTESWGRRFTVTQYTARSAAYGKFNDGLTSTMMKAEPSARIVAVDPKLIPYGSNVWIEGLGWYNAQDCGSAIKGYRLDVMANSEHDAMDYGKQDRFVIVVPPEAHGEAKG
jgi:3D (Asp-Asp-Asp) domain-containing protein